VHHRDCKNPRLLSQTSLLPLPPAHSEN
jgi:hypothetical protein